MIPEFREGTGSALIATSLTATWLYILSTPVSAIQAQAITLALGAFVSGLVVHYWAEFSFGWAGASSILLGTITLLFPFTNPPIMNMPADLVVMHYFFIFGAYFSSTLAVEIAREKEE